MVTNMKPNELGFNVFAMAKPKSSEDYDLLMAEAITELKLINLHLDRVFIEIELMEKIRKLKHQLKPKPDT